MTHVLVDFGSSPCLLAKPARTSPNLGTPMADTIRKFATKG